MLRRALAFEALLLVGCVSRAPIPAEASRDASAGFAPSDFGAHAACTDWTLTTEDPAARVHTAFPELSRAACFVAVRYGEGGPKADPIPDGCGYPDADTLGVLEARAAAYEVAASSWASLRRTPVELSCDLPDDVRHAAATQNARTLRSLADAFRSSSRRYPYAAVGTFGFGQSQQNESPLRAFSPGAACIPLDEKEHVRLSVNVVRARRAAEAYRAGVAPVVTVSGGAVHASLIEAFMLMHLVVCDEGVPVDRVLVDPCADHTHTNVRNTGAMIASIGGRFAYLVTDDGIQSDYMQEWTAFDLLGGSIDQRALRDFGYLLGSWRQASIGMRAGFWYTPYRFWAEPRGGLGDFTCQRDVDRNR